ncbi:MULTISPECIES: glycosyltransferase family 2 protein [Serratia]|jgi:glycosyltransferase involved in cell wall biosynthesis|uniref:Glycosyltransferase family 2 protein n=2 Tax=Serratia marcescens TaxID=615 RepID=A0A5C7CFL6_SERMA|nr:MULTISPECIES: glycosyltransferase family A protein [Serratia]ASM17221.1 glycosyl transferase [Serratia marcescens]EGT0450835.1 glycosyltransferase family 2 protein [Serratia marcescens]EKX2166410.1 glycosyltransferase family 2 protein [Serratia marcescens]ELA7780560.1 glycosyltransferase family 2 protein [Serratia marcescens]ELA7785257.1 glycosyltransferase family 2 protein [Serratia marcescens]
MDFSIVIPIYNSARYLPKTLKRIFSACQGFDYQVILVDDCSDEDDIKYIRQIAATNSNVMLHEKKQKSNAAVSRNLGANLAQSEIVFFLDSDDYFTTNYIIRRMKKHEDRHIDIIFGNYAEVSGDSVRDFNFHYKSGSSGEDFLFLEMGDIRSSTISMRKKSDRRFLFPEFLNKHQDWGFLVNATNLGAQVAYDAGGGVFLDVGRYGRMTAKLNLEASDRFINTFLSPSDRHISGFACKHLLASLYSENAQAFNYYSSRIVRHSLSGKFKMIKWYGDCLTRLGLFSVGGRLLRNVRQGFRR